MNTIRISLEADQYREKIKHLKTFLAETLQESPETLTSMKTLAKIAQEWEAKNGLLPDSRMHPLRRWLEAWDYNVQPDRKTWEPQLVGWRIKP